MYLPDLMANNLNYGQLLLATIIRLTIVFQPMAMWFLSSSTSEGVVDIV
jgi:hypothetical protein